MVLIWLKNGHVRLLKVYSDLKPPMKRIIGVQKTNQISKEL